MAIDKRKQSAFLAAYAQCGSIGIASEAAKVSRRSHANWLHQDAAYAQRFKDARAQAGDILEEEARRRAVEGMQTPVLWKGKVCFAWVNCQGQLVPDGDPKAFRKVPVMKSRYSDRLLAMLLAAAKPKQYSKRHEHKHVRIESQEEKVKRVKDAINKLRASGELPPAVTGPGMGSVSRALPA